jgi:hypothetical protein
MGAAGSLRFAPQKKCSRTLDRSDRTPNWWAAEDGSFDLGNGLESAARMSTLVGGFLVMTFQDLSTFWRRLLQSAHLPKSWPFRGSSSV